VNGWSAVLAWLATAPPYHELDASE
jgi:hypothetical protein